MFRSIILFFLILNLTFLAAEALATERPVTQAQVLNSNVSIWSQFNWTRIRDWILPELSTDNETDNQADRERESVPDGHWVKIVPYNECRDDGICDSKADEEHK